MCFCKKIILLMVDNNNKQRLFFKTAFNEAKIVFRTPSFTITFMPF